MFQTTPLLKFMSILESGVNPKISIEAIFVFLFYYCRAAT